MFTSWEDSQNQCVSHTNEEYVVATWCGRQIRIIFLTTSANEECVVKLLDQAQSKL